MHIGMGYDVHRLVSGRPLILGGVEIPHDKGLEGHSDADVLVHAVCDALLGAAGLDDIGAHFPDNDPKYKNISSLTLLGDVFRMLESKGFSVINIDVTILAEAPKLSPFKERMKENIAKTIEIDVKYVNIKATTTEGLGMIGKKEGIGAMSIALIENDMGRTERQ